ncbi:DUF4294 domain-containing protein [Jejuia pallidilutea]|uniref:Uncharacterized protein DUF4294 n=1 Tax=Jejuia pallidilutea TaxID=504487 RepID=A0A090W0W1_9FLAO|nr:DUF4294 domain-containing protein [Jejuia pallidilutea]PQV50287.1 uncharacterized protein DUF4294 [Jejuia pallidilutea]GAL69166.1 hypothetical protein JCM19301_2345 [Jejuia pallidilutea]GAL70660.1 hypothetical protein JCM19302_2382 [Jejuia pallidilutea]GAL90543.1 hypothetical protein JCM19538_598 [Jejuia pallidilutea]
MNYLKYIFVIIPFLASAQIGKVEQDSTDVTYIIIEGDSIPKTAIDLDEVMLLHKLEFDSKKDRIRYLILRRKTIKVYPYAKLASERLDSLTKRLKTITKKRQRKRYTKHVQKYIEGEFSEELKKLTRTEGQILVKLIHRQTGRTAFDLVKELRNGWRAFWYNTTANVFDIKLKKEYDPWNDKEDYLIEDILQRNFQSGRLERQKSALDIDFYELTDKWVYNKTEDN